MSRPKCNICGNTILDDDQVCFHSIWVEGKEITTTECYKCASRDRFAPAPGARAGEFYHLLKLRLGFGNLSMETSCVTDEWVYRWRIRMKTRGCYETNFAISHQEMDSMKSLPEKARSMAKEMRENARSLGF